MVTGVSKTRACEEAGRDPASLGFSVMTACFVGVDRTEAVERVARFLAIAGDGTDPGELLEARSGTWLAGSVDDVVSRIAGLRSLGVTRVFLQHLNSDDDEMVGLVGERLLPALR